MASVKYNCNKCPAYCCSYELIPVTRKDIKRLAKAFDLSYEKAERRFTRKDADNGGRVMRHTADQHYSTSCRFLDKDTRQCGIYDARPKICREFPGQKRCGYYEFLKFERDTQDDPDWVSTTR